MVRRATIFGLGARFFAAGIVSILWSCGGGDGSVPPSPAAQSCLPGPAGGAQVVLVGTYAADTISTATVAGQDEETRTARVVIEPGTDPLYVILTSSNATIWRFEGEVSRVQDLVIVSIRAQGVVGIDANRITFARVSPAGSGSASMFDQDDGGEDGPTPEDGCIVSFYEVDSEPGEAARAFVESKLGRPVDVMAAAYQVGTIFLPSATIAASVVPPVPAGLDRRLYVRGTFFAPGGLLEIDPAAVVSQEPAQPYEVLPSEMGLAQLVGSGALVPGDGETFYVSRPIPRFPAGLSGSHAVSFLLGRGVPMPPGDPGHSCVISEETGLPLANESLCRITHADDCDLPEAADDDRIVLFGMYRGDAVSTTSVVGQDKETTTARVAIEPGSEPLYLVLSSFQATIFRFEGAVERVARAVLVGVSRSGVTGVSSDRVVDLTMPVGSLFEARCFAPFWEVQSTEGSVARDAVERALGRPVGVHAAQYDVGTVALPTAEIEASVPPPPPPGFDPGVYREGIRFHPGGLVAIDPLHVVAGVVAEPYEVYPAGMGLAQLVGEGSLELREDRFFIVAPIARFPSGLHGARAVTFVLGRGVPMPPGDPGHSCVISAETGTPVVNEVTCR